MGALSFVSGYDCEKPSFICDYDCEKAIVHLRLRLRKSQGKFFEATAMFFQDSEGTDTGTAWGDSSFLEGAGGQALGWKKL